LRDILLADPKVSDVLDDDAIRRLFDPADYTGESSAFIERALVRYPAAADAME